MHHTSHIKGHTITLVQRIQIGKDAFNSPIYEEQEIQVDNVLVAPVSTDDLVTQLDLYGKKAVYKIAIPKGISGKASPRRKRARGHRDNNKDPSRNRAGLYICYRSAQGRLYSCY